jgi:hypothetical protein
MAARGKELVSTSDVEQRASTLIYGVRGHQVMLDQDLADFYGVVTRRLMEQVRRNANRFPEDFMFQLTAKEIEDLRSQNATANFNKMAMRRTLPYVFTEQGALALSGVLKSDRAAEVSVVVARAFVALRNRLEALGRASPEPIEFERSLVALQGELEQLKQNDEVLFHNDERQSARQQKLVDAIGQLMPLLNAFAESQIEDKDEQKRLGRGKTSR